jgi:hypothetical protein
MTLPATPQGVQTYYLHTPNERHIANMVPIANGAWMYHSDHLAALQSLRGERDALKADAEKHCESLAIMHGMGYHDRDREVRGLVSELSYVIAERDQARTEAGRIREALTECITAMERNAWYPETVDRAKQALAGGEKEKS